jgi:subtilase family serine protease
VITAASGDSGYLNWDRFAEVFVAPGVPDVPASLATVVAVGGTSLKLKSSGTRKKETVWNDSGPPSGAAFKQFSATGGGCSTEATAPAWQTSVPGWSATGCGAYRLGNDIAADGDPYTGFDIYSSYEYKPAASTGWLTVGGTSLSSPLVAAMYALAGGARGVSYPASTLYAHIGEPSLYDVTVGGSGYCDAVAPGPCGEPEVNELLGDADCLGTTACDAAVGFDGPSGVGTPNGLTAFGAPPAPTVVTGKATSITSTSAVLNATVDPNGATVTSCQFEWGPTTAYGQSTPCQTLPGEGSEAAPVSASITGLSAGTRYYFRISGASEGSAATGRRSHLKTSA